MPVQLKLLRKVNKAGSQKQKPSSHSIAYQVSLSRRFFIISQIKGVSQNNH